MTARDLRLGIIRPTLLRIHMWSAAAEELLLGTAAQETHLGALGRRQLGGGPALGIYQMEGATERLCWAWLRRVGRGGLAFSILGLIEPASPAPRLLEVSDEYATAMARVLYLSIPYQLPDERDLPAQARYWKQHWNTSKGKGTVEQYQANYQRLVRAAA